MRRVIVVGATVLVAAAAIGLRTCAAAGPEAAPPTRPSTAAESADERPATGPRTEELGVPVGWSRDATGARAAAVSAVSLTGELARAGFITRSDMIRVPASRRYGPTLADLSAAQLDAFIDELAGEGLTPSQLLLQELPLEGALEERVRLILLQRVAGVLLVHGARHRVTIRHGGHTHCIFHGHARFLHRCRMGCRVQLGTGIGGQRELHQKQRRNQNAGYPASLARYGASGEDHGANGIPSDGHGLNLDQIRACRAIRSTPWPGGRCRPAAASRSAACGAAPACTSSLSEVSASVTRVNADRE